MIFLNAMNIKKITNRAQFSSSKIKGFTLLETLIATGIASVVITSALSIVATIYFSQKKVQFSHDFFAENRFLIERITQVARNNTIDYDRYFVEMGPPTNVCNNFATAQVPNGASFDNTKEKRALLGYPTVFYWDTNSDGIQDRNLGGMELNGINADDCTRAMGNTFDYDAGGVLPEEPIRDLYLINAGQSMRVQISHAIAPELKVTMNRQLGADTDGDGKADTWGPTDTNGDGDIEANDLDIDIAWSGAECQLFVNSNSDGDFNDANEVFPVMGDATTESWCDQVHLTQDISPVALQVEDLDFRVAPLFDPYLAFRNDVAQVHPMVFVNLNSSLRNPDRYGFDATNIPTINFETAASSRVFGNIRR